VHVPDVIRALLSNESLVLATAQASSAFFVTCYECREHISLDDDIAVSALASKDTIDEAIVVFSHGRCGGRVIGFEAEEYRAMRLEMALRDVPNVVWQHIMMPSSQMPHQHWIVVQSTFDLLIRHVKLSPDLYPVSCLNDVASLPVSDSLWALHDSDDFVIRNSEGEMLRCDLRSRSDPAHFDALLAASTVALIWARTGLSPSNLEQLERAMQLGRVFAAKVPCSWPPGWDSSLLLGDPRASARDGLQPAKVGRNSVCPCGSGLKYKRCHGS